MNTTKITISEKLKALVTEVVITRDLDYQIQAAKDEVEQLQSQSEASLERYKQIQKSLIEILSLDGCRLPETPDVPLVWGHEPPPGQTAAKAAKPRGKSAPKDFNK